MKKIVLAVLVAPLVASAAPAFDTVRPAIDRGDRPLATFRFNVPGCYPSGFALGDRGRAVNITRATTRTCNVAAAGAAPQLITCQANEACIKASGLSVDPARTNLVTYPETIQASAWTSVAGNGGALSTFDASNVTSATDPFGGNAADQVTIKAVSAGYSVIKPTAGVSFTNGTTYVWSIFLQSSGASFETYLYCYVSGFFATKRITVTNQLQRFVTSGVAPNTGAGSCHVGADLVTAGTTMTATGGGTVFAFGADIEAGAYATSYAGSAAGGATFQRNADYVTTPNPLAALNPAAWCVEGTYTPENGRTWGAESGRFFGWVTEAAANSVRAFESTSNLIGIDVYDGADAQKRVTSSTAGFAAGSTKKIAFSNDFGTLGISVDGVPQTLTPTGAGTGRIASMNATMTIGGTDGTLPRGGYIQTLKVWDRRCP